MNINTLLSILRQADDGWHISEHNKDFIVINNDKNKTNDGGQNETNNRNTDEEADS